MTKPWEETWTKQWVSMVRVPGGFAAFGDDAGGVVDLDSERASLAAAAPELYRALKALTDNASGDWYGQDAQERCDCLDAARAALRKARGEP